MKNWILIFLTIVLIFGLTGCERKTSVRVLTLKKEKSGILGGMDLDSINKLA